MNQNENHTGTMLWWRRVCEVPIKRGQLATMSLIMLQYGLMCQCDDWVKRCLTISFHGPLCQFLLSGFDLPWQLWTISRQHKVVRFPDLLILASYSYTLLMTMQLSRQTWQWKHLHNETTDNYHGTSRSHVLTFRCNLQVHFSSKYNRKTCLY